MQFLQLEQFEDNINTAEFHIFCVKKYVNEWSFCGKNPSLHLIVLVTHKPNEWQSCNVFKFNLLRYDNWKYEEKRLALYVPVFNMGTPPKSEMAHFVLV